MDLEVPRLEEVDAATSLRSEGNEAVMNVFSDDHTIPEREEAPSAELA